MKRLIGAAATLGLAAAGAPLLAQGKGQGQDISAAGNRAHVQSLVNDSDWRGRIGDFQTHPARAEASWQTGAVSLGNRRKSQKPAAAKTTGRVGYFLNGRYRDDGGFDTSYAKVPPCPPGLAEEGGNCLSSGSGRQDRDPAFGYSYRPTLFGVHGAPRGTYALRDGYLLPFDPEAGYIPLLGGALTIGRPWPADYPSRVLPEYVSDYFGLGENNRYRYADGVVYRINPGTSAIEGIAALLTGSEFAVGSRMPAGYDIYNLPGLYRDRYVDTADALYRYSDGRIYEIDPNSSIVLRAIDLAL